MEPTPEQVRAAMQAFAQWGVPNPSDDQIVRCVAAEAEKHKELEARAMAAAGLLAQGAQGGQGVQVPVFPGAQAWERLGEALGKPEFIGSIQAIATASTKKSEWHERSAGTQKVGTWTLEGTLEEARAIGSSASTEFVLREIPERMVRKSGVPLFYLRQPLLDSTYHDSNDALTKKVKSLSTHLDIWDDLPLASDFSEWMPALLQLVRLVEVCHNFNPKAFPQPALDMIMRYQLMISLKFIATEGDGEKIDLLLYDIMSREKLFSDQSVGRQINISIFDEHLMRKAQDKQRRMYDSARVSDVKNIYHHLPPSSPFYPSHLLSSSSTSSTSTSLSRPPRSGYDRTDSRYAPYGSRRDERDDHLQPRGGSGVRGSEERKCFICGEEGHEVASCSKGSVNGGQLQVGGRSYCFDYQRGRYCAKRDCRHECSVNGCGEDHSAKDH